MKKSLIAALMIGCLGSAAQAGDLLKLEAGIGAWNASPSGSINYMGVENDLEKDFGLDKETLPYAYFDIQHPIPIIPNFRLEYVNIDTSGNSDASISFGGQTFNTGTNTTNLELKTIDAIIYYNVLDSFNLNVDLGLDVKYIDGYASVKNSITSEKVDFKAPIPHLYGNVRYDIPGIDVGVEGEGKYFTYDGAKSFDFSVKVDYNLIAGFKVEAGYRTTGIEIPESVMDDYDLDTGFDYKFSGPFIGLNYTF